MPALSQYHRDNRIQNPYQCCAVFPQQTNNHHIWPPVLPGSPAALSSSRFNVVACQKFFLVNHPVSFLLCLKCLHILPDAGTLYPSMGFITNALSSTAPWWPVFRPGDRTHAESLDISPSVPWNSRSIQVFIIYDAPFMPLLTSPEGQETTYNRHTSIISCSGKGSPGIDKQQQACQVPVITRFFHSSEAPQWPFPFHSGP